MLSFETPIFEIYALYDSEDISMVSCQKGPTRHAYAWQLGPFWQYTLDFRSTPYKNQVTK